MKTGNDPGQPAEYVVLAGNSRDGRPHGGRQITTPPIANRRVRANADRFVSLRTAWHHHAFIYVVGVEDEHGQLTDQPQTFPTLRRARNAANRLYAELNKESN